MNTTSLISDWREKIVYAAAGPQPQTLMENDQMKVIVAGLEAGQQIPPHAATTAVYHFLEGAGWMTVDGEQLAVGPGATVVMPAGAVRGIQATTRLAFLATRVA
jgi:quercetin dioxygenase-like cupin family protein